MDELGGFEPTDTTGFIQIESIRIKKCVLTLSFPEKNPIIDILVSGGHKPTCAKARQASNRRTSTGLAFRFISIQKISSISDRMLCLVCSCSAPRVEMVEKMK
jgi:hypothetical protein